MPLSKLLTTVTLVALLTSSPAMGRKELLQNFSVLQSQRTSRLLQIWDFHGGKSLNFCSQDEGSRFLRIIANHLFNYEPLTYKITLKCDYRCQKKQLLMNTKGIYEVVILLNWTPVIQCGCLSQQYTYVITRSLASSSPPHPPKKLQGLPVGPRLPLLEAPV
jgi:hypothetical protein